MEFGTIIDAIDKGSTHALVALVVVLLWLQGRELKLHRKELKKHREDEEANRKELVEIGKAVVLLLERDRERSVRDIVRDTISGVHDVPTVEVDPALQGDEDTPVEAPRKNAPRARSSPRPGEYRIVPTPIKEGGK